MPNFYPSYPSYSYISRIWLTLEEETLGTRGTHLTLQEQEKLLQQCNVVIFSRAFIHAEKFLSLYILLFGNTDYFIPTSNYKEIGIMQAFEMKQQQHQHQLFVTPLPNSNIINGYDPQFNVIFKCNSQFITFPWSVTIPTLPPPTATTPTTTSYGSINDVEIKIHLTPTQLTSFLLPMQHVIGVTMMMLLVVMSAVIILTLMKSGSSSIVLVLSANVLKKQKQKHAKVTRNVRKGFKFIESNYNNNNSSNSHIKNNTNSSGNSTNNNGSGSDDNSCDSGESNDVSDVWDLDQWMNYGWYQDSTTTVTNHVNYYYDSKHEE